MLNLISSKNTNFILISLYIVCNAIMIYFDFFQLLLLPFILLLIYLFVYRLDVVFLLIVFCTPLSFNFEDLALAGIGFYFPTEPLLLLFTLIFFMKLIFKKTLKNKLTHYKHPITKIIILQFLWLFITSVTSELPIVSFKFLIARTWFIVPVFFYAIHFFNQGKKQIFQFLWCFVIPVFIVSTFTLINHYNHSFSEEAGHWVMWPFFKDHTSYGAILAICIPIVLFLLNETKKLSLKYLLIIILVVLLVALYFSYTRAAWLSILGAGLIYLLYYYKIKLKWIISLTLVSSFFIFLNFNNLSYLIEKNDAEHTTENFSERIESMSNISSDASNLERLNRWSCAIDLFKKKPLLGWGPGTYSFVYAPFQNSKDLTIISTNFGDGGNAHSEYLGPLAEQGLIGMIIMIFLVATVFYSSGNFYLNSLNVFDRRLTMMVILSLSTYFSHGILNNYLDTDKASIPVWGLIAIFVVLSTYSVHSDKKLERIKNK